MKTETTISIEEGDKIIAEFMGITKHGHGWTAIEGRKYAYQNKWYPRQLKYHSSWDWLMPIVEKIEKDNDVAFIIEGNYCTVWVNDSKADVISKECETKLQATWQAVVEFIQWYNQNK